MKQMKLNKKTWMIIPLGIGAFVVFYLVFRFLISALNLKTPGREDEETQAVASHENVSASGYDTDAIFAGLGGKENIVSLDNCVTRLRLEVKDSDVINDDILKKAGAKAVIRTGKNSVQVVIGTNVESVAQQMKNQM